MLLIYASRDKLRRHEKDLTLVSLKPDAAGLILTGADSELFSFFFSFYDDLIFYNLQRLRFFIIIISFLL